MTLTQSDGHYSGSFQMPANASTLTLNTGTTGGGTDENGDNTE